MISYSYDIHGFFFTFSLELLRLSKSNLQIYQEVGQNIFLALRWRVSHLTVHRGWKWLYFWIFFLSFINHNLDPKVCYSFHTYPSGLTWQVLTVWHFGYSSILFQWSAMCVETVNVCSAHSQFFQAVLLSPVLFNHYSEFHQNPVSWSTYSETKMSCFFCTFGVRHTE